MRLPDQANVIKVAAVVTATPRWVVALLASEGFSLPESWRPYWIIFSVLSAAGMAIVEGVSFAYVFNAWKRENGTRRSNIMLALAILSAALFVVLLSPSIAASVRGQPLATILSSDPLLWLWSAVVAASTIAIVASVGYAQKQSLGPVGGSGGQARAEGTGKQPEPIRKLPEVLPEPVANGNGKRAFKDLLPEEVLELTQLSAVNVAAKYHITERAARAWRAQANEILQIRQ